mgnify:FL=1
MQKRKNRKNRVIHEVIHIIHRKVGKKSGLHSKIIECLFCEEIIKLSDFVESLEKLLTFNSTFAIIILAPCERGTNFQKVQKNK